ncbi:MAG: type II secretion system GspH family protein, partial [Heliobacteriaceae bacterium]|nr:type II secretion system GspH family protein [Heliobacteriaceae bacterium]
HCKPLSEAIQYGSRGFTLAEVLITLGIIGVVAALVMPGLINDYKKKFYVTSFKKTYSKLQQALQMYKYENDGTLDSIDSQVSAGNFVKDYFKTAKTCVNTTKNCFADRYTYIKNSSSTSSYVQVTSYILADGTTIRFYYGPAGYRKGVIFVDSNGAKGPNIIGRDAIYMILYNNGLLDDANAPNTYTIQAPLNTQDRETTFLKYNCNPNCGDYGWFGKILNDGWEMNY